MSAGEGVEEVVEAAKALLDANRELRIGSKVDFEQGMAIAHAEAGLRAALRALTANQGAGEWRVPEGWRLVPEVPTVEMVARALKDCDRNGYAVSRGMVDDRDLLTGYAAMLAASPTPPVRGGKS